MRKILPLAAGMIVALGVASGTGTADSEPGATGTAQATQPSLGEIVIGEIERRILHDYYARNAQAWVVEHPEDAKGTKHKHKTLPPGIAKKDTLPPGIAKQLVRNGQLPPGLEYRDLPPDLIVQLPPLAPQYRYVIVDDRVLLIRAATNVILDLLKVPAL
jgi:hypothetical protein